MTDTIDALFPEEHQIPEQYRILQPIRQECYLIDGELRRWGGPLQEVLSPVRVRTAAGCGRKLGGEAPQLTGEAAREALAVRKKAAAAKSGKGPAMPPSGTSAPENQNQKPPADADNPASGANGTPPEK